MDLWSEFDENVKNIGCISECDVPLKDYTTFKVGGPCKRMLFPEDTEKLALILQYCSKNHLSYFLLGNGSNLLVSDAGFDGAVIHLGQRFASIELIDDHTIHCKAGAQLSKVCQFALEHSLSGLEFAYGIPGTVGGAVYMNAGAYGGEMKDVVTACEHFNAYFEKEKLNADKLGFAYRESIYSANHFCVTDVYIELEKGSAADIRGRMDDYLSRRKSKQPLEYPSAGSTFKRPKGAYASALIDECGLKGASVGGAMVSKKHAGFIINYNHATCSDIIGLMNHVAAVVKEKTGYVLEPEVKIIL